MSQDLTITDPKPTTIYEVFETDEGLENEGVVFDCGFGKFKVAYVGNPVFQKAYAQAMKPYAEASARGILDEKIQMRILQEVYAKTIVKGWEDVIGKDGEPLEFSEEACLQLFKDLPRLFGMIRDWAGNFANFRKIYADAVVGNSLSA